MPLRELDPGISAISELKTGYMPAYQIRGMTDPQLKTLLSLPATLR